MPDISEKIDQYIANSNDFARPILQLIREAVKDTGLDIKEEWKWRIPCFSYHGLVCGMGGFKKHVSVSFFQGALLQDEMGVLIKGNESNVAMRTLKYVSAEEVDKELLSQYIKEAALNNEKGLKVDVKKERKPLVIPAYFMDVLRAHANALAFFEKLSYSHKKEYVDWIIGAKRETTRESRFVKMIEMLEKGERKNEKYNKC